VSVTEKTSKGTEHECMRENFASKQAYVIIMHGRFNDSEDQ